MRTNLAGIDTATPAVVLKFDPNVMHHGGLGAIRTLGRLGIPVYGVHEQRSAPAASSRYLSGRLFWQPDPDQAERTLGGLSRLAEMIGRPAVLIPTDDAGAIFLSEHGGPLRGSFLFPDPPPGLPRRLAGKYSLYELCQRMGVPAPLTALADSPAQAGEFAALAGFPLVAKLTTPWLAAGSRLRSTSIITSQAELGEVQRACERGRAGLMLQELVPGGPGDDWFFHGYRGTGSVSRAAFTGVKDRSYPAHAGLTSLGRAVRNDDLREDMRTLLARLSYQGIADLDLRRDARTGQYKLLDFNPRLGAQFRLFRDQAGMDVVLAAYLDLTGQPVTAGEQAERSFLVENYDPLGALAYWRRGELGLRAWLASVRAVDEAAWYARDDLRPFGLMCARMGWRAVSRRFARPGGGAARHADEPRFRPGRMGRAGSGAPERGPAWPARPRPASPGLMISRPSAPDPAGRKAGSLTLTKGDDND
jgi:predicted ATP-grasp superfamily ATP-dependent carboligase